MYFILIIILCCPLNSPCIYTQKIEKIQPTSEQDKWPKMRMGQHAACCLGFNTECPHLLMSGGRIDRRTTLQDIWILNIKERKWKEVRMQKRIYH